MRDMTVGRPRQHLWAHALPLLLGNWMQLSYNAVDSIIAGRFIGKEALAAEGIAAPVMNLVILAISGVCIGAGVLMSEAFGAKDRDKLCRVLANTLLSGMLVCCVIGGVGMALTPQILQKLEVPEQIHGITVTYLRITFLGAPFTFCYNALAAGFKSIGDAKTPLKFLAFSSILNAVLDLIFLGLLGFGILCSAATTVFAEAVSAVLALLYMRKHTPELIPGKHQWRFDRDIAEKLLLYGGPTALQQAIQPVCKVLIQGQVNALGVAAIAAYNAVTRVDDFACIPEQSISSAISTYIAQNRGAKKSERIRPGFRQGMRLEFCYWIFIGVTVMLLRTPIVSLFVTGEGSAEVVALGREYLKWMALFYLFPAVTNGMQGFYRGMGKMYTTVIGTFLQAATRAACATVLAPKFGIVGIAFSCAIGWSLMLLFEVPYYAVTCKKHRLSRRDYTGSRNNGE